MAEKEEKPEAEAEEDTEKDTEKEDGEASEAQEGEDPKGGFSKKKLIIIIIVGFVLIFTPVGLYFSGILDSLLGMEEKKESHDHEDAHSETDEADGEAEEPSPEPVFFELEEFTVNLSSGGSQRPSFIKLKVALELSSPEEMVQVSKLTPRIRDSFLLYLRELRPDDLQGSAGQYRLRQDLLLRTNKAIFPLKAVDIHFKELIVH